MLTNTLSDRQDLQAMHESTEGFFGRELKLLLLTNKKSAYYAINKKKFRNELKEFGSGLYFVETLEDSKKFDIKDRAVVLCRVFIGVSLILTKPNQNITEKYLNKKNCHSVKGYLNSQLKYYIVYNYNKVLEVLSSEAETRIVRVSQVSEKCINHLCKFHGITHNDECLLFCEQKICRFYKAHHKPPCELKCDNKNCELFEIFHESDCKIRCIWENCIMFGTYHEKKCIHIDHENSIKLNDRARDGIIYNKDKYLGKIKKNNPKKNSKQLAEKIPKIRSSSQNCASNNLKGFKLNDPSSNCRKQANEINTFFGNNKVQDPTKIKKSNLNVLNYWAPKDYNNLEPKIHHNTETTYFEPKSQFNYNQDFEQHDYLDPKPLYEQKLRNNIKFVENESYNTNNEGLFMFEDKYKPKGFSLSKPQLNYLNDCQLEDPIKSKLSCCPIFCNCSIF